MIYIFIVLSSFCSFLLLQYLHCLIIKDIYWKYIIGNSIIISLYLGLLIGSMLTFDKNTPFPELILTYFLIGIVVVLSIYSIIKKHFIMDHPKIATWHYPIFELVIFIFGLFLTQIFLGSIDFLSKTLVGIPII